MQETHIDGVKFNSICAFDKKELLVQIEEV